MLIGFTTAWVLVFLYTRFMYIRNILYDDTFESLSNWLHIFWLYSATGNRDDNNVIFSPLYINLPKHHNHNITIFPCAKRTLVCTLSVDLYWESVLAVNHFCTIFIMAINYKQIRFIFNDEPTEAKYESSHTIISSFLDHSFTKYFNIFVLQRITSLFFN